MGHLYLFEDPINQRRMRALLELLGSTGVRLDELGHSTWKNIELTPVDGSSMTAYVLKVIGKGNAPRTQRFNNY